MEVKDIFAILADYLNFVVDLLFLRGMEKYGRLGTINKELVSFFVAGVFLAYIIAYMKKIPGYESEFLIANFPPDVAPKSPSGTYTPSQGKKKAVDMKEQTSDIAGFVILSIFGAVAFHGFLTLYQKLFGPPEIGTIKDTVNASLAVGAIYNPINALLKQIWKGAKILPMISRGWAIFGAVVLFAVSLTYLAMLYYWIYALAKVHRTTQTYMVGPLGVIVLLAIVAIMVVMRAQRGSPSSTDAVAKQGAAANDGPAIPPGNSTVTQVPPSVSVE